jgi:hypothetical protein
MSEDKKIQIIKHENPKPLKDYGDILYPFVSWETTSTADGWYTKFPEDFYTKKSYYPLTAIDQNPWDSLVRLGVNCFNFKESVQYECPYNKYIHFWCVPILIFTDDVKFWTDRYKVMCPEMYLDSGWAKKFFPAKVKNGLPFTKVQRALLGPGYTGGTSLNDGSGYIYDTLLAMDNGDFLGSKVWIWFNK